VSAIAGKSARPFLTEYWPRGHNGLQLRASVGARRLAPWGALSKKFIADRCDEPL
jgi:hypothetical protein